jgi:hypothetical protein
MSLNRWCCVLVALLGVALPGAAQSSASQFLSRPLVFEPNRGQADSSTKFLSRGNGHSVLLKNAEAVITFANPAAAVRMKLVGQNPRAVMEGLGLQSGVTNYFVGNDPAAWRSSVPQFAKVKYGSVYPGIDLVYYGIGSQLEYDFLVDAHADPSPIQIEFEGADEVSISPEGDLVLRTRAGEVRHQRPVAYQTRNGAREPVAAHFVLKGKRARFSLAAYDRSLPLVIDPKFIWATYMGGPGDDQGNDLAVDAEGNVYVTGATQDSTADPAGIFQSPSGKSFQLFVTKINPAGAVVYSTYFGGTAIEEGHSIALDPAGNIYVGGFTTSTDFPLVNAFQSQLGGPQDGYVLKLNNDGNTIIFSTYLGGTLSDRVYGIAADPSGSAIVAGNTQSSDFPVSNAFQSKKGGGLGDAFVTRFAAGGALASSTYLGGSGNDQAYDVARDVDGNIVVTGFTTSQNFPVLKALYPNYRGGSDDVFVTKFNDTATSQVFSTYLGGTGADNGVRLTVDVDKNIYVTGYTTSLDFPLKNPAQLFFGGIGDLSVTTYDAFLIKFHPDGQDAHFSTYIGGEDTEGGVGVVVDKNGFIYLTGFTNSLRFYAINALGGFLRGERDGFVIKIAPDAQTVVFSSYLGGFGAEGATSIAVDDAGNVYVTGYTSSLDFPLAVDTMFQGATAGGQDGFLVKINSDDVRTSNSFTFPVKGGASVFTAGQTANPVFGYAAVDVASGLSPTGLEIVDLRSSNVLVNEVAIPAPLPTHTGRLFARAEAGDATAVSMVNPGSEEVTVDYYFTSGFNGETGFFGSFKFPPKAQFAALLTDQPFNFPSGIEGTMTFTSSGPIAAIALRVQTGGPNPVNLYLPIIDPYTANNRPVVVPEFVDGGGWSTEFQLINPTESTLAGEIRLFKNTTGEEPGVPAEIATDKGVGSVFPYSIPPRGLYKLVGRGESGETSSGHADIVPAEGSMTPLAYGVINFTGTGLLATTIEAVEPGPSFRMYVESSGNFPEDLAATPAVAISNSTDFPAIVDLTLTGFDGTPSGLSAQVTIPPKTVLGRFLKEIPGFEQLPSPFSGVLNVTTSNIGVTFVGFRTRYNEQRQLLMTATGPLKDLGNTNPVIFPHLVDGGGYATQFIVIDGTAGSGATGAINFRDPSGNPLNVAIAP